MGELNVSKSSQATSVLDPPSGESQSDEAIGHQDVPVNCPDSPTSCHECPLAEDCTEKQLVEACKQGYVAAQRRLYEDHSERILSLMMRITGNEEDALDLSQQTFIRVLNRIGDFRGESALGTWIHRVAVNEALQHLRRKKRQQRFAESIAKEPRWSEPIHEDPSLSLDVHAALRQLPERMREMVLLRYEQGLDYAEIAESLGVKQGTVASGLNRARKQLRSILK